MVIIDEWAIKSNFLKMYVIVSLLIRSICTPRYSLLNGKGNEILNIEGPVCTSICKGGYVEFDIFSPEGYSVGKIRKTWYVCVQ